MLGNKKIWLAWVIILAFCIHFLFTLNYALEGSYLPEKFDKLTGKYMLALFHQNWRLFAPDPPHNEWQVLYKYKTTSNQSNWIYLSEDLLKKHYKYRISWHAKTLKIHEHYARNILSMPRDNENDIQKIKRTRSYYFALNEIYNTLKTNKTNPIELELAFAMVCKHQCKSDTLFMPKEIIGTH